MMEFQENTLADVWREEWTVLFHRILPPTAKDLTSTTVNWYLKVKDKKCDVDLSKNYGIPISMQKTSPIHKLTQ